MILLNFVLAVIALQVPPTARPPTFADDAYLDAGAATMVAAARERTRSDNEEIIAYQMVTRERISVGLRALRRDRLLYRRETAARVTWRREGDQVVEVLGARSVAPIARPTARPLGDRQIRSEARGWLFDPSREWLLRLGGDGDDDVSVVHPLAPGGEEHYRFRSGETTVLRLAGDRTVRLVELQVIPRRSVSSLVAGSFWLDADSYAAVRGVFRLASPARLRTRTGVGAMFLPIPDGTAELGFLTLEYGLWEGRWWLPRLIALEGSASAGSLTVPLLYEQRFEDYRIVAEGGTEAAFEPPDTAGMRSIPPGASCEPDQPCARRTVLVPADATDLLDSEYLPASPFLDGPALITGAEIDQVHDLLRAAGRGSLAFLRPQVRWNVPDGSLFRYNRVEGAVGGASVGARLGPWSGSVGAAAGHAAPVPTAELRVGRSRPRGAEEAAVYRRLDAFLPEERPLGLSNSLSALLLGRDEGDYYHSVGVEATSLHSLSRYADLGLRLFGERQQAVEKGTNTSLPRWRDGTEFRPNPPADEARQAGADLALRIGAGLDPDGLRGRFDAGILAETGTASFVRPTATAAAGFPLPGPFVAAVEVAGGTTIGSATRQRLWNVGGPATARGFDHSERVVGEAFWRSRAEVANRFPGARVVAFTDAAWAGPAGEARPTPRLLSAGLGVSFLDGFLRADAARALRGGVGWRLHLSVDAPL